MKVLLIIFILAINSCVAKNIIIQAKPGGKYVLPQDVKDYQISIIGSGSQDSPFYLVGNNTILSGNSYIKISNTTSNIVIKNLTFKNNNIDYKNSTSLIEIGNSKKSVINNILIDNIDCLFNDKSFVDNDKQTQFHWINIFGNNVTITNSVFEGKRNRLPIIHINSNFKNVVVENSIFKNVAARPGEALEAIRIGLGDGQSNALIKNNTFENYFGDSETISVKADGVKIDNNKFINSRSGVSLRLSNNSIITNNRFDNVANPIRVAGKNHLIQGNFFNTDLGNTSIIIMLGGANYKQVDNLEIKSNTYSKEPTLNFIEMPNNNSLPTNVKFSNNIINGQSSVSSKIVQKELNSNVDLTRSTLGNGKLRKDNSKIYSINLR